jgi:fucose permease
MSGLRLRHDPSRLDLYAGFLLAGMATTLLGPLVPALTRRWGLADAAMGGVFATQFLSSFTLTLASSSLVVRHGSARVLALGFVLIAIGLAVLGVAPWSVGLIATVCYGAGLGLVLPTTNVAIATLAPGREASAVSLVNVAWSAGAVIWPLLVAWLARDGAVHRPLWVVAALVALLVVRLARRRPVVPPRAGDRGSAAAAAAPSGAIMNVPMLLAITGGVFFVYSGVESAIGGWIAEHLRRVNPSGAWRMAPAFFWGALAGGRLLAPVLLHVVRESRLIVASIAAAGCSTLLLSYAPSIPLGFASATLVGFTMAPVFPIAFGAMTRTIGPVRPRAVGPLFALTAIGSAAIPWLVGACSGAAGSLRIGLLATTAGCGVMLGLTLLRLRHEPQAVTART